MVLVFVPASERSKPETMGSSDPATKMWDIYLAALCSMIVFFAAIILLPSKLSDMGFDEADTGYYLAYVSMVAALAAVLMPRLERRLGGNGTTAVAFIFYAAAHALFFLSTTAPFVMLGGALIGCGFGFSIPLVNHLTLERSSPSQRGRLLGYLSVAIFLGQFLSSFIELLPLSKDAGFLVAALVALSTLTVFLTATASGGELKSG